MKKITLFMALIMSCTLLQVNAQVEIPQAEGLFVACTDFQDGDIYTDSGGSAADYPNGEETTMEFQAPAGETVSIEFTSFNVEAGWDSLTVTGAGPGFDGDYDGTALPPTMVSAPGGSLTFFFDSDTSVSRPGWTANIGISACPPPPPPPPYLFSSFCSEEMPLEFNPPFLASAGVMVSDTSDDHSGDLGVIGTALGEYVLESVVINVEGGSAQDLLFAIQAPGVPAPWVMGAFAGGTDGTDTAVDLTFTDTSTNNYNDWTGGAPAADYFPIQGAFNDALAGLDINGEWFIIVQGNGEDTATVNSFCINWAMSSGDAPEIFCIDDFAADNDEGVCGAVVNFAPPIAIDAEDGVLDAQFIVQTGGIESGGEFPVGDNDVTFTATDSHGNETSCTFVITVNDAEAPVAVCQAVTVTLDASGAGSIAAADLDGGSTDNCAVTSFEASQTTFSCADVGEVTVTLSAIDAAGNVSTCEATVTVVDDIAPVIACIGSPGATDYMEEFEGASVPADWSTTINSGSWDWTFGSGEMPFSDPFATNAAIFDDDAAGLGETNNASLNTPVWSTVGADAVTMSYDYSLDELGAGETLSVEVYDGAGWVNVVTYDADVIPPTNSGDIDGTAFANADFQVRFTYDDAGSWGWGAGVDNFMITVNTPPQPPLELALGADGTLSIPAGDLIMDVDEACGYTVTSGGSAACDITTESNGFENGLFNNGAPFWVAQQVVFETTMDVTGFELNLFHDPGATIDNVLFVFYEDDGGLPGAVIGGEDLTPVSQTVVGANFGFDVSTVSLVPTASTIEPGTYWIGTLATSSTAGTTAWEVSTAADGLNAVNTQDGITWGDVGAGVAVYSLTGQCGSDDPANFNFDCSNLGENVVEVFVTDDAGNVSSCSATVIISDVTAPVLVCGPGDGATTVVEDFDGSSVPAGWSVSNEFGDYDWTFGAPGAGAAGGTEPFSSNAAIFDDDAAGNGNVNNASLLTPVWDMSEATTVTMSYDVSFNELGAGETLTVDVYDGSGWVNVVTYDTDILTPENSGVIDGTALANTEFQVRWTYDDAGSWGWNAGVDNFQITFANPPANQDLVTITLGEDGTAELDAMDFLSEAYDACGIDILIADLEMVTCDDIGAPIEVTVFASDASGNIASCSINVEVVDTMAPVLTCPEDVSVMVDPDGSHTVADYIGTGEATATDNCTDPITDFTQDPAPGTILGVGEWVITFTATDEYGNVSTCDMNLDLTILGNQDNELSNAIVLYPNPANEQVTLSNSSNISLETAMIYDLNGKLISQINLQDMQSERVIDVSSYATGVYMVHITGEQSSVVKRMIKE
jgi:hypothetical protein